MRGSPFAARGRQTNLMFFGATCACRKTLLAERPCAFGVREAQRGFSKKRLRFLDYCSICSMTNASTTSPSLTSLNFSKLRPHS